MGELIRSFNWSATSLGSPDKWPAALKQMVSMMLTTKFPVLICWGKDYIQLYNDSFCLLTAPPNILKLWAAAPKAHMPKYGILSVLCLPK